MRDYKSTTDDRRTSTSGFEEEFVLPEWPDLPEVAAENEGVQVDALTPGTTVCVYTRNSEYSLTVLDGGHRRVLVRGGILPTPSEARVEGATDGGTVVHGGWIEVNRSLELVCGPRRIITSRVQSISIEKPSAPSPSHHHAA
jgi:hypothetical protein